MRKIILLTFLSIAFVSHAFAQSGYIYSTLDLLEESKALFDKLNRGRIDGKTFEDLLSTSDNMLNLPKKQGDYFIYIDSNTGKQKPKGEFEKAFPFNGQFALVEREGMQGVINQSGRWVVKPTDPRFSRLELEGMFLDARNGKFEYVIKEEVPDFPYVPFKQNGRWGVIAGDPLKPAIPYGYDAIIAMDMNGCIVLKEQRLGYVSLKEGKELTPFEYVRLTYTPQDTKFNNLHYFALYNMDAEVWDYYMSDYSGLIRLFSSNQYCFNYNMGEFCVGKFKIGDKYNVFFSDGSTLPNSYKWITDVPSRGLILAVDDEDRIVIVDRHGNEFVVCE